MPIISTHVRMPNRVNILSLGPNANNRRTRGNAQGHESYVQMSYFFQLNEQRFIFNGNGHSLQLHNCYNVSDFPEWFDMLLTLRSSAISDCLKVTCLPVALRRLTRLQHLAIHRSYALKQHCWTHKGII